MSSAVDIENIVNITKHSNNYKNTIYTDNEYKIVSNELISNIETLRTSEDVIKSQKNIQRKYKISLSKANLIYFYKSGIYH